jgi:hypothetical protein
MPCAAKNGKHIAPPMSTLSASSRKRSSTPSLSVTFAPPTIATIGGRVGEDARERLDLALEQPARGARQELGDAVVGGVGAVRGAERVVDEDVAERGVALAQRRVVLGLPRKKRTFSSMSRRSPSPPRLLGVLRAGGRRRP